MDWVTKSLLEKIKKLPISQYKRFAMAGVKVLSAFGKKNSSWEAAMRDSTDRYGAIRDKQKRTEREAKNWPDGGYAALKKLADKLYEGVKQLEGRKKLSPGELYKYQKYAIIRFYSEHALRGDLADPSSARSARTTSTRVRARGSFTSANTKPSRPGGRSSSRYRNRCKTHSTTSCRW